MSNIKQPYSQNELAEMKERMLQNTSALPPNAALSTLYKVSSIHSDKPKLKSSPSTLSECPSWVSEHLFLSWDFYPNPERSDSVWDIDSTKLSISQQEEVIIDDILNCMSGVEGKLIKTATLIDKHAERTFNVARIDPALRDLTKRILPVCVNFSLIIRFVEEKSQFKWGLVNHALCSAIKELLKNHYVFVCQLENLHRTGNLSLQKLWYYVSPIMGFMDLIASVIKTINKGDQCGSAVIDLIYDKVLAYSGDPKLQELLFYLAQTASKPYLKMLEDWIYKGQINDPYNEFMIVEDKDITKERLKEDFNEKFWERKYSLNKANMPKIFTDLGEKILLTGKYLNAIYETGKVVVFAYNQTGEAPTAESSEIASLEATEAVKPPAAVEILFTTKIDVYKQIVERTYNFSSQVLLNLLLKDHKLMDRLRSLKHYFLLDQSDFMVHFMDIAEEEMNKNFKDIKVSRLESLLELSLRITSANGDPYKDDLRVKLFTSDLKAMIMKIDRTSAFGANDPTSQRPETETNLDGLSSFSLDYVIKWPLSLIINKRTLFKYQILFRHIFLMKDIERQLCNVWLCTKSGELALGRSYKYYSMSCALKQRMLNFVQNLLNYMTFEVFESSWNKFEENIKNVSNIDDVITHHDKFLDYCLRESMITSYTSFCHIHKILGVCQFFSKYVQSLTMNSRVRDESVKFDSKTDFKGAQEKRKAIQREISEELNKIVNSDEFSKIITDFDEQFSQLLLDLLAKIINEMSNGLGETKIGNVLYRLDFNDHYRDQLERLSHLRQKRIESFSSSDTSRR